MYSWNLIYFVLLSHALRLDCSKHNVYLFIYFQTLPASVFFWSDAHSLDSFSLSAYRDDHRVRVVVTVADLRVFKDVSTGSANYSPNEVSKHNSNPCMNCLSHCGPPGGQTTGAFHRYCPREWQDGLAHAGFSCQPGFQGEPPHS